MPYQTNQELPEGVKNHLPKQAQDIYRKAFNHAYEEYQQPDKRREHTEPLEELSHRVAWSAVKKSYVKHRDGNWHPK